MRTMIPARRTTGGCSEQEIENLYRQKKSATRKRQRKFITKTRNTSMNYLPPKVSTRKLLTLNTEITLARKSLDKSLDRFQDDWEKNLQKILKQNEAKWAKEKLSLENILSDETSEKEELKIRLSDGNAEKDELRKKLSHEIDEKEKLKKRILDEISEKDELIKVVSDKDAELNSLKKKLFDAKRFLEQTLTFANGIVDTVA